MKGMKNNTMMDRIAMEAMIFKCEARGIVSEFFFVELLYCVFQEICACFLEGEKL